MIWTSQVVNHLLRPDDTRDTGPALETLIDVYGLRGGLRRRVSAWRNLPPEGLLGSTNNPDPRLEH